MSIIWVSLGQKCGKGGDISCIQRMGVGVLSEINSHAYVIY